MGRNGSGKSTLLQIIAGTLTPSSGEVEVNGRVAALLELGSGFNPEFSGRENVFLNGQILGIERKILESQFDKIAAFADIGQFIDQPVKTYSSGMSVRLAFAVAISVDPDILIVDEALSVGDEAFQRKCFGRITELKEKGTTILFVSHAGGTVVEFCDRAILLDAGEILLNGSPKAVVSRYQKLIYAPPETAQRLREEYRQISTADLVHVPFSQAKGPAVTTVSDTSCQKALYDPHLHPAQIVEYEKRGAEIIDPHLETLAGERVNMLEHGEEYVYAYQARFTQVTARVQFGMLIKSVSGLELGGGVFPGLNSYVDFIDADDEFSVCFRFRCLLNPGVYFLNAGVLGEVGGEITYLHRIIDVVMFRVQPTEKPIATAFVNFDLTLIVELLPSSIEEASF